MAQDFSLEKTALFVRRLDSLGPNGHDARPARLNLHIGKRGQNCCDIKGVGTAGLTARNKAGRMRQHDKCGHPKQLLKRRSKNKTQGDENCF